MTKRKWVRRTELAQGVRTETVTIMLGPESKIIEDMNRIMQTVREETSRIAERFMFRSFGELAYRQAEECAQALEPFAEPERQLICEFSRQTPHSVETIVNTPFLLAQAGVNRPWPSQRSEPQRDPIEDLAEAFSRFQERLVNGYQFSPSPWPRVAEGTDFATAVRNLSESSRSFGVWWNGDGTQAPSEHAPSGDAMRLDLPATETCWKKVGKVETCGEPSDPSSETGVCSQHLEEYKR